MNISSCFFLPSIFSREGSREIQRVDLEWETNLNQIHSLKELSAFIVSHVVEMTTDSSMEQKVKQKMQELRFSSGELDLFFEEIAKQGVVDHFEKLFEVLGRLVSRAQIEELAAFKTQSQPIRFTSISEWAKQRALFYPKQLPVPFSEEGHSTWNRYRSLVLYFIPNVINLFLSAFTFLDGQRYTSLWEKYLVLDIVYRFFQIPYMLIKLLEPVLVVPVKVYAVASMIISGIGLSLYSYYTWLRPVPDQLPNCTNLTRQIALGQVEPHVTNPEIVQQIKSILNSGRNVMLVGHSGEGKTTIAAQVARELRDKKVFTIDSGNLVNGSVTFGHGEQINQIRSAAEGFEDKIVLFFDEGHIALKNNTCANAWKLFMNKPSPLFMTAITYKEFEKIKDSQQGLDNDMSFRRRFVPLFINPTEDSHLRLILQEFLINKASEIPVENAAIDKVISLSSEYRKEIGRPSKALNLMEDVVRRCQEVFDSSFVSAALRKEKKEYEALSSQMSFEMNEQLDKIAEFLQKQKQVAKLTAELEKDKQEIQKLKHSMQQKLKFKDRYFKLTHQVAEANAQALSEDIQKMYLLFSFYGIKAFQAVLASKVKELTDRQLDVSVSVPLVERAFKEIKEKEDYIYESGGTTNC
jgi:ATP-dependent Clp protease ATP-binding subunit ClpB